MILSEFSQPPDNSKFEFISIVLQKEQSPKPRNIRCIHCGKLLFVAAFGIKLLFEGKINELKSFVDFPCTRCGIIYRVG